MTKISKELKEAILKDPILNNFRIKGKTRTLVNKIEEYQNYTLDENNWGKTPPKFLTDEELSSINEHQEESDWSKIIQALCNNGLEAILFELMDYEERVRKNPATSIQAIHGLEGNVQMKAFSPQLATTSNLNAENIQSISKVAKDVVIDGDFAPTWTIENKEKEVKNNTEKIENEASPSSSLVLSTSQELMKNLIKKELKGQKLEKIAFCTTWFNPNCAIVISKKENKLSKDEYSLSIAVHEPTGGKREFNLYLIKVAKKITSVEENWQQIIEVFGKALNSKHPVAELCNNSFTNELPSLIREYPSVIKSKLKVNSQTNPDDYLQLYDIVKRKMPIPGKHVAIYLGKNSELVRNLPIWEEDKYWVAHISNPKEKESGKLFAKYDTWEHFLKGEQEIEIEHSVIPFKKKELIQKHIDLAVKCNYGEHEYDLLQNNCEHFATMCVYGVGVSYQSKRVNTINLHSEYLLKAIKESNNFFKKLAESQVEYTAQIQVSPKSDLLSFSK